VQYRTKKILTSKIRRAIRWEFWPTTVFYIPIIFYLFWLVIRHQGLRCLSVNPGLPMSGLIGEKKAASLNQLKGSEFLARFHVLSVSESVDIRVSQAINFMQELGLTYPVVLKPDFGQRGQDVAVVRDQQSLHQYLQSAKGDVLIQEHIEGEEFGVFYIRYPEHDNGEIFSITFGRWRKNARTIVDGKHTDSLYG